MTTPVKAIEWLGDSVRLIDQTQLPRIESYLDTARPEVIADAIRSLKIRGAPAIGIAAAYAVALAAAERADEELPAFRDRLRAVIGMLARTRPTAVNLFWALRRMTAVLERSGSAAAAREALRAEARAIHAEDEAMCERIGAFGAALVPQGAGILTHCNTGALATGGAGTAQSIITSAHAQGKRVRVYADETRPLFQGARLTAWELQKAGVDVTVITDSMAAVMMREKLVDMVIVGADRIASNGDTANKIGTYGLAVLARHHAIPLFVAAPDSTIDRSIASGDGIPIEDRAAAEIAEPFGVRIVPERVPVRSPSFDVTPAALISAIITDRGVHRAPYDFSGAAR